MDRKFANSFLIVLMVLSFHILTVSSGEAAGFPEKPVRMISPYAPGSGNDIACRGIQPYLEKHLGVRVIIDNKPGADGRLGVNEAWKAKPDGYTLVQPGQPAFVIMERIFPVQWKSRDFTHIFAWSADNFVLVVNSETWKTGEEFIAAAQAKTLSCGITGIGTVSYVVGLMLEDAAKLKPVNWVPFRGGAESMTQLAGKHIDFAITTTASARPLVDAGRLRPLILFSNEQDHVLPNAPLMKDAGLNILSAPVVRGALAPPGVPPRIVAILEKAFFKAIQEPEYIAFTQRIRAQITPMNHVQFRDYIVNFENNVAKYIEKIPKQK